MAIEHQHTRIVCRLWLKGSLVFERFWFILNEYANMLWTVSCVAACWKNPKETYNYAAQLGHEDCVPWNSPKSTHKLDRDMIHIPRELTDIRPIPIEKFEDYMFPSDGNKAAAKNYCRNPVNPYTFETRSRNPDGWYCLQSFTWDSGKKFVYVVKLCRGFFPECGEFPLSCYSKQDCFLIKVGWSRILGFSLPWPQLWSHNLHSRFSSR